MATKKSAAKEASPKNTVSIKLTVKAATKNKFTREEIANAIIALSETDMKKLVNVKDVTLLASKRPV